MEIYYDTIVCVTYGIILYSGSLLECVPQYLNTSERRSRGIGHRRIGPLNAVIITIIYYYFSSETEFNCITEPSPNAKNARTDALI